MIVSPSNRIWMAGIRRYDYDALNNISRMEAVAAPVGSGLAVVTAVPEPSIVHDFERDAAGRMVVKSPMTGVRNTVTTYWTSSKLSRLPIRQANNTPSASLMTPLGRPSKKKTRAGVLQHCYDELGNLNQTRLPDGRWLNRLYYGSGHLHQINLDGRVISDFERYCLHRESPAYSGAPEYTPAL